MPDGSIGDYDNVLPDAVAKELGYGDYVDSNGSEVTSVTELKDSKLIVEFYVYGREYTKKKWPDEVRIVTSGFVRDNVYVVQNVFADPF